MFFSKTLSAFARSIGALKTRTMASAIFGAPASTEERRKRIAEAVAASGRGKKKDPLYLTLQGCAARKLAGFTRPGPNGKSGLFIPRSVLALSGNSPKALGYVLRRDFHPGRASSIRKIQRAQRIAIAHLGAELVMPAAVEAPHVHPRHERPASPAKPTARQKRAVARIQAEQEEPKVLLVLSGGAARIAEREGREFAMAIGRSADTYRGAQRAEKIALRKGVARAMRKHPAPAASGAPIRKNVSRKRTGPEAFFASPAPAQREAA